MNAAIHRFRSPRSALILPAILAAMAVLTAPLRAAEPIEFDRWYVVKMQGQRAGWMRSTQSTGDDGRITTRHEMNLTVGRAGAEVKIALVGEFVETEAGEPVRMKNVRRLGQAPVTRIYRFTDQGVEVVVEQGGRTTTRAVDRPQGDWLTPAEAARFVQEHIDAGDKEFSYKTIDPMIGLQVVTNEVQVQQRETTVKAMGKTVPAIKWTVSQDIMPGVESVEHVDRRGVPIRGETRLGGVSMTILASEQEVAQADVAPAELMVSTLVKPDRPIDSPRHATRATYTLSLPDGELPQISETGAQRVRRLDNGGVRVEVRADEFTPAPQQTDPDRYLETSSMLDADDPAVAELTSQALENANPSSKADKAEALRRFVHEHIEEKSLDVGLATASEVCRTKQGDCTEHAVLLAAMLRSAGIPSRVASGLIYVEQFAGEENAFGYHMWTQALLAGEDGQPRWVDLDATLHKHTSFDAAHIALLVSGLAEGETINSMAALAPMLGRLDVSVESVSTD